MDYGAKRNLIKNDTRENLLGNRLVLTAPKDSKIDQVSIAPGFDLAALVGNGRIATGDVRAVPAGLYAKAALEKLGVWSSVESKLANAENVRAALVLVSLDGAPLGIVYETDAKIDPGVKIVGVFPEDSHPPIIYPVAMTKDAKLEAAKYLAFFSTPAGEAHHPSPFSREWPTHCQYEHQRSRASSNDVRHGRRGGDHAQDRDCPWSVGRGRGDRQGKR